MENLQSSFTKNLDELLALLNHTNKEFEMVADELEDLNLRNAFDGLAAECMQYAQEIYTELKSLGIHCDSHEHLSVKEWQGLKPEEIKNEDDEIETICNRNEDRIMNAYRNTLNGYYPFPSLKDIMMHQMNGLKSSFLKIKTLNMSRVASNP